jgi:hypothetical protein
MQQWPPARPFAHPRPVSMAAGADPGAGPKLNALCCAWLLMPDKSVRDQSDQLKHPMARKTI